MAVSWIRLKQRILVFTCIVRCHAVESMQWIKKDLSIEQLHNMNHI